MKQFTNWLPIYSIVIIFFSFVNLHFYYDIFGVQIYQYIEVSEIIFSLTTFLVSSIFIVTIITWVLLLTDLGIQDEDKKKSRIRRYFKSHKIKALRKLAPLFLPMRVTLMINASILILLGYIISSLPDSVLLENSFGYDYLGLIFLLFLSIFVVTATSLVRKRGSESQAEISFFMIFFVGLIAFSAFRNNKSAHFIMKGNPKYTVTLKTNSNEIYATNDSILYIGGTKNFYFLYNRKTRGCYVVPSNIVVEAKVKRIRDGL